MPTCYLSSAYLAPTSYYMAIAQNESVVIERNCNYIKQTYRNRCNIVGTNGVQPLSIPVEKPNSGKCATRDILISNHNNWQHLHWHAIKSAYGSTPFFEYYQDYLIPFYEKSTKYLFDLNEALLHTLCPLLQLDTPIGYTEEYKTEFTPNEIDLREAIHPKKEVIENLHPLPYYQVFDQKLGYQPNMSIIDLLFNMGTESILVLKGVNK